MGASGPSSWPLGARRSESATARWSGSTPLKRGDRLEVLMLVNQAACATRGDIRQGVAEVLALRHDHGAQGMAKALLAHLTFFEIESSSSFVRALAGNGVAERFMRTSMTVYRPAIDLERCTDSKDVPRGALYLDRAIGFSRLRKAPKPPGVPTWLGRAR